MSEKSPGIEQQAALIERAIKLREGARTFTREIVTKTFPGNPVKPEDQLSIFTGIDTNVGGKLGILITKPSTGEAMGGTESEDKKVDVLLGGMQNDFTPISGECQGSCRLNYVMIPPIDEAAVLAAQMRTSDW
jgi:hypothetical protein